MYCETYKCKMSEESCERFAAIAKKCAGRVKGGESIFQLSDAEIDRMMRCGKCAKCGLGEKEVERLWKKGAGETRTKILQWSEWGFDRMVTRDKAFRRRKTPRHYVHK